MSTQSSASEDITAIDTIRDIFRARKVQSQVALEAAACIDDIKDLIHGSEGADTRIFKLPLLGPVQLTRRREKRSNEVVALNVDSEHATPATDFTDDSWAQTLFDVDFYLGGDMFDFDQDVFQSTVRMPLQDDGP